jgi:hypothetical protein
MSKKHNNGANIKQYFLIANTFCNFLFWRQVILYIFCGNVFLRGDFWFSRFRKNKEVVNAY